MTRPRPDLYLHPDLGEALRHLRGALRQADVVERMREAGEGISSVWLSQLETGKGHPTHPTLDALLRALGSDRAELERLLEERPWVVREGEEWAAAEEPAARAAAPATPPPPRARVAAPPPHDTFGTIAAEAAELGALYARLRPDQRRAILERARRLADL